MLGNWWSKCPPRMDEKMRRMDVCSSGELACHERHSTRLQGTSNREHGTLSLLLAASEGVEMKARRMEGCSYKHQLAQVAAGDTPKE